jgi:hypothetical protein
MKAKKSRRSKEAGIFDRDNGRRLAVRCLFLPVKSGEIPDQSKVKIINPAGFTLLSMDKSIFPTGFTVLSMDNGKG